MRAKPIDQDDADNVLTPRQPVERENIQLSQTVKVELAKVDAHRPQLIAPNHMHVSFIPIQEVEQHRRLQVILHRIDIKNLPSPLKMLRVSASHSHARRRQYIQPVGGEPRTYDCYLCGKSFRYFCRLKVHMPIHTDKSKMCSRRYKNASDLNVHVEESHSIPKVSVKKAPPHKPLVKESPEPTENHPLDALKMDPIDLAGMEIEWATLGCDDFEPFVWDESDLQLTLPMANDIAEQPTIIPQELNSDSVMKRTDDDQMHRVSSSSGMLCDSTNRPKIIKRKSPSKCTIWQKEAVDPSAWHVDILQQSQSKHTQRLKNATNTETCKSTETCIQFHNAGDHEFELNEWDKARHLFNCALCYAEPNSGHISTAYAKRALCYFNEHKYQACWTNLMLAEKAGMPEELLARLEHDKKVTSEAIRNESLPPASSAPRIEPMLSFPYHPLYPEMANALQIDSDEYFGRHIRARQSIAVGQILMIERGFIATSTSYYGKCCICLTEDPNLMPCSRCTRAMLCTNCVNSHKIECELQMAMNVHAYPWLMKVLRSFLNAVYLFKTVEEMMEFVADAIGNDDKLPNAPIINLKSKYRAFLQLITVPAIQPSLNTMVTKLHAVLLNHPIIGRKFQTIKSQRFLAHLLVHHICVINAFTLKIGRVDSKYECLEIIAPITSYLKHSCAPNVSRFFVGNSVIVVAMRPIEPNEELFVGYCDILIPRNERQHILQTEYGFQCKCERCTDPQSIENDDERSAKYGVAVDNYVESHMNFLTNDDQVERKILTDHIVDTLQRVGRKPWDFTTTRAYVVFSLLLSKRFQNKLQY